MDSLESWLEFRRCESYTPSAPAACAFCGARCTGDTTDDETSAPVCDDPDTCPANACHGTYPYHHGADETCSLPAIAESLRHPTQGQFAADLWQLLSGPQIGPTTARELYLKCGYKPFAGYPLTRRAAQ